MREVFLWLLDHPLLLGLLVSIGGGGIVTLALDYFLRLFTGPKPKRPGIPGWLTGIIERVVFTFLIAYEVEDIGTLMAGWLVLKLASNWNRPEMKGERPSAFAFAALLLGLVSLAFAALGGRIALRW